MTFKSVHNSDKSLERNCKDVENFSSRDRKQISLAKHLKHNQMNEDVILKASLRNSISLSHISVYS